MSITGIKSKLKARVIEATVWIEGSGGQGVVVPGTFILTATHCIKWNGQGAMALGDYFIEDITTKSGTKLRVRPLAADPVSDLAVLGPLDEQEFSHEYDAFEAWCNVTESVIVRTKTPRVGGLIPVHVLTHEGVRITGRVTCYGRGASGVMWIETDERIKGGTSGGPVVDSNGQLVGVVSHSGEPPEHGKSGGMLPIASLALPVWVWLRIKKAQMEPT